MSSRSRTAVQLFRCHFLAAQLEFEQAHEGTLECGADDLRALFLRQASALELDLPLIDDGALGEELELASEINFPDLQWVGTLAHSATTRLLYRGTSAEDSDVTRIMVLELAALSSAKQGGITEEEFMEWHKSMFSEDVRPRAVIGELELLVASAVDAPGAPAAPATPMKQLADSVDVAVPIIPGFLKVDLKKMARLLKRIFRRAA